MPTQKIPTKTQMPMLMPVPVPVVVAPQRPNVQPEPRASLSIIRRILLARLLAAAAAVVVVVTMRAIRTTSALPVGAALVPPLHRIAPSLIGTSTVIPPFRDPRCHPAKRTCRRQMLRSVPAGRSGAGELRLRGHRGRQVGAAAGRRPHRGLGLHQGGRAAAAALVRVIAISDNARDGPKL